MRRLPGLQRLSRLQRLRRMQLLLCMLLDLGRLRTLLRLGGRPVSRCCPVVERAQGLAGVLSPTPHPALVMPGFVPGIHLIASARRKWQHGVRRHQPSPAQASSE
jgi:hypothetical protein